MPLFPQTGERSPSYVPDPRRASADRPPQLNETVCGCRCGCGEPENGDGVHIDEDGASTHSMDTLVASNHSEVDESSPPSPNGPDRHINEDDFEVHAAMLGHAREEVEVRTRFGGYWNDRGCFHLSHRTVQAGRNDGGNSMENEPPGSESHSAVTSKVVSVRCISPGPGIGAWAEVDRLRDYYFLASPLRLTPQRRYCRGRVVSHLIVHDEESVGVPEHDFYEEFR